MGEGDAIRRWLFCLHLFFPLVTLPRNNVMDTTTTLKTFRYNPGNVILCRGSTDFWQQTRTAIMTTTASGKIFPLWICYFLWSITCVCLPLFGLLKSNAVIIWTNACSSKRRAECLNKDLRYKRERTSHFRQHLISILIKNCSARGRLDLFSKELQNKTTKPNWTGVNPFVPWYNLN